MRRNIQTPTRNATSNWLRPYGTTQALANEFTRGSAVTGCNWPRTRTRGKPPGTADKS